MAKKNNSLVLGLGLLGVTGVGVWFYLKNKEEILGTDESLGGGSSATSSVGVEDVESSNGSNDESSQEVENSVVLDKGDDSSITSGGSSNSYSLGSITSSSGTSIPTVTVSNNNPSSQNISIANNLNTVRSNGDGTSDAGVKFVSAGSSSESSGSVTSSKSSSGSSSIVSRVVSSLTSPLKSLRSLF